LFPIAGGLLALIIPWMFGRILDFVREMLGL
jgi:flagellar biosynthesis protein FliQ